jgi:hypothetical protein
MLGGDARTGASDAELQNCYGCWSSVSRKYAALTAGGSMDLFRVSRFTPYLQSGAGLYYSRLAAKLGPNPIPADPNYVRNSFSFGVNGGLGIKTRLGSHEFFVEQMLHAFDVRALNTGLYPVNIGFRF